MRKLKHAKRAAAEVNESFSQFSSDQVIPDESMLRIRGGDGENDGGENSIPPPPPPPDDD